MNVNIWRTREGVHITNHWIGLVPSYRNQNSFFRLKMKHFYFDYYASESPRPIFGMQNYNALDKILEI